MKRSGFKPRPWGSQKKEPKFKKKIPEKKQSIAKCVSKKDSRGKKPLFEKRAKLEKRVGPPLPREKVKKLPEKRASLGKKLPAKAEKLDKGDLGTTKKRKKLDRYRDFLAYKEYFYAQEHTCLECGAPAGVEGHHEIAQDNRTLTPFCTPCHRGQNIHLRSKAYNEALVARGIPPEGFCLHRGTESARFRKRWPRKKLLSIGMDLYKRYLLETGNSE